MESCLFCKIANKKIPSTVVYEDENVLCFLDIHPVNIGHTLIIPKQHHENLYAMPDETLAALAPIIKKIAIGIKKGLKCDGINIAMNNDSAAGQIVEHSHIHVIPRYASDGFTHWKGVRGYEDGEAVTISEKIKSSLK